MAQVDLQQGAVGSDPPTTKLDDLRMLAAAAADPGGDGVLAEALRRLHSSPADPDWPSGLAYHDLTSGG